MEANASVTIMPDRILFASDREDDMVDLYWTTPDGERIERITQSHNTERWARWAPDGRRLVYASPSDHGIIFVGDDGRWAALEVIREVTDEFVTVLSEPAWAPDGFRLAYIRTEYARDNTGRVDRSTAVLRTYILRTSTVATSRLSPTHPT